MSFSFLLLRHLWKTEGRAWIIRGPTSKRTSEHKHKIPNEKVINPVEQGRPVPCRAQIWWIRAVPNISVPCPHDPVPCQIFPCRALMIRAQKYGSLFCGKKRSPAATYPQVQGFQKYGSQKKAPAATYPQVQGFQKYGSLFCGKKRRLRQRTHKFRASRNLTPLRFRPKNKVFERPG